MSFANHHPPMRPRARTTVPPMYRGTPRYITPTYISKDAPHPFPHTIPAPTDPRSRSLPNTRYPVIYSVETLISGVQQNPEFIYRKLADIVQERDMLRIEAANLRRDLASVSEDYEGSKRDWMNARQNFEQLLEIGVSKQMLLWRFIDRLQSGKGRVEMDETGGGGEWISEGLESEPLGCGLSNTTLFMRDNDDEKDQDLGTQVEKSQNSKSPVTTVSGPTELTLESQKIASEGGSEENDGSYLDPNADPFIPSPCVSFSEFSHSLGKVSTISDKESVSELNLAASIASSQSPSNETKKKSAVMGEQNNEELYGHGDRLSSISERSRTPIRVNSPTKSLPGSARRSQYGTRSSAQCQGNNQTVSTSGSSPDISPELCGFAALPSATAPITNDDKRQATAVPIQVIKRIVLTLPPKLSNICPNSLLYSGPCDVPGCTLVALCTAYNQLPDGCPLKEEECEGAHIHRSCVEEIDFNKCHWWRKASKKETRKRHFAIVAHQKTTSDEEWQGRVVSAGLRAAHRRGDWGMRVDEEL